MSKVPIVPTRKSIVKDTKPRSRVPLSRLVNSNSRNTATVLSSKNTSNNTIKNNSNNHNNLDNYIDNSNCFNFVPVSIGDPNDPADVVDYEHFIYRNLRTIEGKMSKPVFLQLEITIRDRNLLIDALCRFHYKLGHTTNTFYRFIGILDRFLSKKSIMGSKLMLYGCAAFFISSKIEEIYPCSSSDLIKLSQNQFTSVELFSAEIEILNIIGFDSTFATPLFYLTQFMRIESQSKEVLLLSRYLLEIMQSCEFFFSMKPSEMASIAVLASRKLNQEPFDWPSNFSGYTGYSRSSLEIGLSYLRTILKEENREETSFMRRKYGSELFSTVANIKNLQIL